MARRVMPVLAALAILGACAGTAPGSTSSTAPVASPSAGATTEATAQVTAAATQAATSVATLPPAPSVAPATATASATPGGAASTLEPQETFHGAPDLETLIPDRVGDIALDKLSQSGQDWFDSSTGGHPQATQMLSGFLASLGASVDDISAAGGNGFSDTSDAYVYVMALRIAGADSAALLDGTTQFAVDVAPLTNSGISATATSVTLGGKNATLVTAVLGGTVIDESYYYGSGDVVFRVSGDSEETIGAALELLP